MDDQVLVERSALAFEGRFGRRTRRVPLDDRCGVGFTNYMCKICALRRRRD